MRFKEMHPLPAGISEDQWDAVYNNANSTYYNFYDRDKEDERYTGARTSGRTRLLAFKDLDRRIERGTFIVRFDYRSIALKNGSRTAAQNDLDWENDQKLKHVRSRIVKAGAPQPDAMRWDDPPKKDKNASTGGTEEAVDGGVEVSTGGTEEAVNGGVEVSTGGTEEAVNGGSKEAST